jgi:hypothetical protein
VELSFCAGERIAERFEQVVIWMQTVKDCEEAYLVAKDGYSGTCTLCGCLDMEEMAASSELEELKDAQEKLLHWQNKLVEVGGTVPQAPALEPQVQARPARESDVMVSGADL